MKRMNDKEAKQALDMSIEDLEHNLKIIKDCIYRRLLIDASSLAIDNMCNPEKPFEESMSEYKAEIHSIIKRMETNGDWGIL